MQTKTYFASQRARRAIEVARQELGSRGDACRMTVVGFRARSFG